MEIILLILMAILVLVIFQKVEKEQFKLIVLFNIILAGSITYAWNRIGSSFLSYSIIFSLIILTVLYKHLYPEYYSQVFKKNHKLRSTILAIEMIILCAAWLIVSHSIDFKQSFKNELIISDRFSNFIMNNDFIVFIVMSTLLISAGLFCSISELRRKES